MPNEPTAAPSPIDSLTMLDRVLSSVTAPALTRQDQVNIVAAVQNIRQALEAAAATPAAPAASPASPTP